MNRRISLTLTGTVLLGWMLAASPQTVFAESDPFDGVWQLNLAKSKYSPGPPPKSSTLYMRGEGQNRTDTSVTINADGSPRAVVASHIFDNNPHPASGLPLYDTSAYTRVNANTISARYLKAGSVTQTATWIVTQDGKTLTVAVKGIDASGRQVDELRVYEKQ
jgi:hypothetical protein